MTTPPSPPQRRLCLRLQAANDQNPSPHPPTAPDAADDSPIHDGRCGRQSRRDCLGFAAGAVSAGAAGPAALVADTVSGGGAAYQASDRLRGPGPDKGRVTPSGRHSCCRRRCCRSGCRCRCHSCCRTTDDAAHCEWEIRGGEDDGRTPVADVAGGQVWGRR